MVDGIPKELVFRATARTFLFDLNQDKGLLGRVT
jgi:hypothetical protein